MYVLAGSKKHHYVPQFLLARFADSRGRLDVHRLDATQTYSSSTRDLGHRNDLHTYFWPHRSKDSTSLERSMSELEREANTVIRTIHGEGHSTLTAKQQTAPGSLHCNGVA